MAAMAAMAAVLSSTGIRECGNRTTRWQDTLTGHVDRTRSGRVRRAVWQEFGPASCQHPRRTSCQHPRRSSGQHPRMISGQHRHHQDEFRSTSASSGWVRVNRWPAKQIDILYGIWIVYEKWAGNGPRILGKCRQTHTKPPGSAAVGLLQCAGYVICDSLERPAVAIGPWIHEVCGLLFCEDEEALLAVQCVLYLHPKPSMTTTPPPHGSLSTGIQDQREWVS